MCAPAARRCQINIKDLDGATQPLEVFGQVSIARDFHSSHPLRIASVSFAVGKSLILLHLAICQYQCYIVTMVDLLFWLLTAVIAVSLGGSLARAYRRRNEERREAALLEKKRLETQRSKRHRDRERW